MTGTRRWRPVREEGIVDTYPAYAWAWRGKSRASGRVT